MKKKLLIALSIASLTLAGCGNPFNSEVNSETPGSTSGNTNTSSTTYDISVPSDVSTAEDVSSYYQEITSDFQITTEVEDGYEISGNTCTITKAGDYTLSGKIEDGQVVVDATEDDEVKLILNGVSITCSTNSPIMVKEADSVKINSADGTYNEVIDTRSLKTEEDDANEELGEGAIYAACDLSLTGSGALSVSSTYNNGVHTKKDLKIKNVVLKVNAVNNALKGKDSITVESGNITAISSGGDGFKTEDSDVSSKGNQRGTITIEGGTIDVYAACDAFDASYDVVIEDGANVNLYTDKYSSYTGEIVTSSTSSMYIRVSGSLYNSSYRYAALFYNSEDDYKWEDASFLTSANQMGSYRYYFELDQPSGYTNVAFYIFNSSQSEDSLTDYVACTSGQTINTNRDMFVISSKNNTTLSGSWSVYSSGSSSSSFGPGGGGQMGGGGNSNKTDYSCKGIKADNEITINGGNISIYSSDDAIHANRGTTLENGETGVGNVTINGGNLTLTTLDDGIHADYDVVVNGGTINVLTSYEGIEGNYIEFNGGTAYVNASDDGVNAAGSYKTISILVTGGYLDVTVGTGDVDGIDSNGNYTQTGGFVITRDGTSDTSGNASGLDIDGTCLITGGTFICAGSCAETPSSSSTNNWVKFYSGSGSSSGGWGGRPGGGGMGGNSGTGLTFSAGTYSIDGTDITFTLSTSYKGLWISSDSFTLNSSYKVTNGTTTYSWTQSSNSVSVTG